MTEGSSAGHSRYTKLSKHDRHPVLMGVFDRQILTFKAVRPLGADQGITCGYLLVWLVPTDFTVTSEGGATTS
jgi:hypothetical protein